MGMFSSVIYCRQVFTLFYWPRRPLECVEVQLYSFQDLGTRLGWGLTPRPGRLYPRERPVTHCTGGWMDPRAGLDGRKSRPLRGSIPDRPVRSQSLYRLNYRAHCNILFLCIVCIVCHNLHPTLLFSPNSEVIRMSYLMSPRKKC